ncbi:LicD family protein [Kineothrix sp. MSJ-39]|uniref:LicD family protein n=1 Tax=Kineothrix sp. MSJ-39 TaxID=2841533 RepID=UPI001C0FDBF5|nr:LicD family protein [Kineothrix sp. MSJ-39]MBU5430980.1 LicD family protein [Kineothrix sp. MSJ-39]
MNVPESYFRSEEREGFCVEEIMKRYWACTMDIVQHIDRICKKYGLTYYADWGTLLGAVRHNGYIPWDDDIDLALKRKDYQKLVSVLPEELPKEYLINTCFSNPEHKEFFTGITDGSVLNLSKEYLARHHQCPFVAIIDIFPLDYLPRNEQEAAIVKELFILIWETVTKIQHGEPQEKIEKSVVEVETYLKVSIDRSKPLISQLWRYASLLAMSYTEEDGDYLTQWCSYVNRHEKFKLKKEWYEEAIYLPFEYMQMPVPNGYDEILKLMYGESYMIPVREKSGHDYPAFKDQLELLRNKVKELKELEK